MGDMGDYWRDVKQHFREKKHKHDNAVFSSGLGVMRKSIEAEGLRVVELGQQHPPQWRISADNGKFVDFWPTTGTLYQPKTGKRDWVGNWKKVGKEAKKLLK